MDRFSTTRDGLRFFGRVSASVSHEIKNVFAVINESAGLIDDFTLMAEKGMPIQPERLKKAAGSILNQIRRGDAIIKNMNAFAHSIDEDVREVDLAELVGLTVALATRMADMKQVRLTLGDREPATLSANPFDLMRLLHSSIAAALDALAPGDTLAAGVKPAPDGACFTLAASGKAAPAVDGGALVAMAGDMGLAAEVGEADGALTLRVAAPQAG
ncbi:sensor histidine kinase [Pseudodesulfovibrio sp.]|uniref:sensor histidine kinase n=1 Tax=Pseudodesulfovibrio sp. TaxID=2035812 RepID=UPI0026236490|nr:sensor histidine kinase [Pseudodesulfovibrio sp.]MDD3313101.1 sensor histidine kinase [Pseudodesulfovibrio sp.]